MIKVTFEFPTLDAAIVAMGKMVEPKAAPAMPASATALAAAAGQPAPATRKGRNDKGVSRKKSGDTPATKEVAADKGGTPESALPGAPAEGAAAASISTETPATVVTNDVKPIADEALTAALEPVFKHPKGGLLASQDIMARFGVKRLRELKPEQRAEFVKYCADEAAKLGAVAA